MDVTINDPVIIDYLRRLPKALEGKAEALGGLNMPGLKSLALYFSLADEDAIHGFKRSDLVDLLQKIRDIPVPKAPPANVANTKRVLSRPTIKAEPKEPAPVPRAPRAVATATAVTKVREDTSLRPLPKPKPKPVPLPKPITKDKVDGAGTIDKPSAALAKTLRDLGAKYEHVLIEQGGGGHCGYCSFVAGLNEINKLRGIDKKATVNDMRKDIVEHIKHSSGSDLFALFMQENYVERRPKGKAQEKSDDELLIQAYDGADTDEEKEGIIEQMRESIIADTKATRWATEYDLSVLSNIYSIGIFLFKNGKLYHSSMPYNGFTHYITMANIASTHYQCVGFREKGSTDPYRYVFSCLELPTVIIDMLNKDRETNANNDIEEFSC